MKILIDLKYRCYSFTLMVCAITCVGAEATDPVLPPPVEIDAQIQADSVIAGDPVLVTLTIENRSKQTVALIDPHDDNSSPHGHMYETLNPISVRLNLRAPGEEKAILYYSLGYYHRPPDKARSYKSPLLITLMPGAKRQFHLVFDAGARADSSELSERTFLFSKPGEYKLSLIYWIVNPIPTNGVIQKLEILTSPEMVLVVKSPLTESDAKAYTALQASKYLPYYYSPRVDGPRLSADASRELQQFKAKFPVSRYAVFADIALVSDEFGAALLAGDGQAAAVAKEKAQALTLQTNLPPGWKVKAQELFEWTSQNIPAKAPVRAPRAATQPVVNKP